jgi:myo-inositol-1(or 4)-monophosphatase
MSDMGWSELRELSVRMASDAGALALAERAAAVTDITTKSSQVDIVTAADKAAEAFITTQVERHRPNDAIVGEEGANKEGNTGLTWFIDPIDGTTNFYYGLPGWVVSIAVGDSEGIGAAAVFDPVSNEMYSAHRKGGATLNNEPLQVRATTEVLAHALVGTGFSYLAEQRQQQAELLVELLPQVRDIRRLGSAAKDLCMVARGAYDAYFEAGLNQWDLAAGWLIAREAGARVEFLTPPEDERPLLLGSAPQLFDQLAAIIG